MMDDTKRLAPPVRSILQAADRRTPPDGRVSVDARPFAAEIDRTRAAGRVPVIAEIKPTSPTTEETRTADPVALAESMVAGGATALSVLTEPEHFGGSVEALERVRDAVDVPVLRKDFIRRPGHLDAVAADAVLLIARFVDDLSGLVDAARDRGMEPLVEVHDTDELVRAVEAGADCIGINNRDLARLSVDLRTVETVAPAAPSDATLVAESGIRDQRDVRRMIEAGADAMLVGSAIMAGDVESRTRELVRA